MSGDDFKRPGTSETYDRLRDMYRRSLSDSKIRKQMQEEHEQNMLSVLRKSFPEATMGDVQRIGTADIRVWDEQGRRCEKCYDPLRWCEHFGLRWEFVRMHGEITLIYDKCPAYIEARKKQIAAEDAPDNGVGFRRRST